MKHGIVALALWLTSTAQVAAACSADVVQLRGDWGQARFRVDVADDDAERARGLMHVEDMPQSQGMLFLYERESHVAFWMRNTLIPLDMIFIDAEGVVQRVHDNAVPHDETPIPSGAPVVAVLEINGGLAARFGIDVGSEVQHPGFAPRAAVWPCD